METEKASEGGSKFERVSNPGSVVSTYIGTIKELIEVRARLQELEESKETQEKSFPALAQIFGQANVIMKGPVYTAASSKGKRYYTIAKDEEIAKERLRATATGKLSSLEKKAVAAKRQAETDNEEIMNKKTKL